MTTSPLPLALVTGFLGAGKTTLLNRIAAREGHRETAILVNELGDVGLDQHLLSGGPELKFQMEGGCICCSRLSDLAGTLGALQEAVRAGRIAPVSRVIVETTGLAKVGPIVRTLLTTPALVAAYELRRVTTVVDAAAGLEGYPEMLEQVRAADVLVISKAEGRPAADVAALTARLVALNPGAQLVAAEQADLSLLLGETATRLEASCRPAGGSLHTPTVRKVLAAPPDASADALLAAVDRFSAALGPALLRAKGFFQTAGDPAILAVQVVGGRRTSAERIRLPAHAPAGGLVVIATETSARDLETAWASAWAEREAAG